ncbi:ABC transporter ATP-binding protein [Candidatus Aerophobetes bacterium]|uniref:ABC transporter ATP-binding protein n=1 Tax=Aerophobetes bacterium TaxID=2030807 RepID=A0A497E6Q2_UNCAE|nr:MAG: ABC transporter ATP-binding protein [Candidatus Aerophobetes bacterium]
MKNLLTIQDLRVYYYLREGAVRAVDGVSFFMKRGETVGLVGESGSGKSTLGLSILKLVSSPGKIVSGKILFNGNDIAGWNEKKMRLLRGSRISMVFQDPMTSLNPLMRIEEHLVETIRTHQKIPKAEAKKKASLLLNEVGIPPERGGDYPHQFSGGMRQRIGIALAIALNPDLLIADEFTSSLDVIVQFQILNLMKKLKASHQMGLIFISHDISLVSEIADRIALMYAGQIVEFAPADIFFSEPLHPYSEGLLNSVPNIELSDQKLNYIPGMPPDLVRPPDGCRFYPRCPYGEDICRRKEPPLVQIEKEHMVKCFRYDGKKSRT